MKKSLLLTALVGVALTGCVNEEVASVENQKEKVSFAGPVMATQTRANVKGEITGVHYNADEDFKVFSKLYKGGFAGWNIDTEDYFQSEGDVAKNEGNESKYWSTATVYYWPDVEYNLAFAAYSPAELETAPTSIQHTESGLQIIGFRTEEDANEQYDLMYSDRIIDRNKSNNGSSAVPLVFNHALSSIVFSSEKEDETVNYEIKDLILSGKFIQEANFNQNIVESVNMLSGTAKWESFKAAEDAEYEPEFNHFNVTTVPTQFTQNTSALLLIPQQVPESAYITLVYDKVTNPGTGSEKRLENTVQIFLKDFAQENGNKITNWEMGKRYVYRIAFGQNKRIYFEPTTTDWVQEPTLIYTIQ